MLFLVRINYSVQLHRPVLELFVRDREDRVPL